MTEEHSDSEIEVIYESLNIVVSKDKDTSSITNTFDTFHSSSKFLEENSKMAVAEDREFIDYNRDSPDYEAYAEEEEKKRRKDIKRKRMKALQLLKEAIEAGIREKRKRGILYFLKLQTRGKHQRRLQMKWKYHRRLQMKWKHHRIKSLRKANNLRKRKGRI